MDERAFPTTSTNAWFRRTRAVTAITIAVLSASLLSSCAFLSRASETSGGLQANAESFFPALSADGRWVAFISSADNLVAGDTNEQSDVFVRDNWTKAVSRVSVSSVGAQTVALTDGLVSISDDGRIVVFSNLSDGLTANDSNNTFDVYWHDRDTDQDGIYDEPGAFATVLASARPDGRSGNAQGGSLQPVLNADGSVLAFASDASDLVAAPDQDTNGTSDVFASTFDLATGQRTITRIVSRQPTNPMVEANEASQLPSIDASGDIIAFETLATNLLPGDTNNVADVAINDGAQLRRGTGPVQAERSDVARRTQSRRHACCIPVEGDEPRDRRHRREQRGVRDGLRRHRPDCARPPGLHGYAHGRRRFVLAVDQRRRFPRRIHLRRS